MVGKGEGGREIALVRWHCLSNVRETTMIIFYHFWFYERMFYAVRCLILNENVIFALCWTIKQLSHEPEKIRWLNGIWTQDLSGTGAVLWPTELWSHTEESRSISWAHVFSWKECHMKEFFHMTFLSNMSNRLKWCPSDNSYPVRQGNYSFHVIWKNYFIWHFFHMKEFYHMTFLSCHMK